jgi:hypothetical protein
MMNRCVGWLIARAERSLSRSLKKKIQGPGTVHCTL